MIVPERPEQSVRLDVAHFREHVEFRILEHSQDSHLRIVYAHVPITLDAVQNEAEIELYLGTVLQTWILTRRLAALSAVEVYE